MLGVQEVPNLLKRSVESCASFTILSSNILEDSRVKDLGEFIEALDTFLFTFSNTESRLNISILARILVRAATEQQSLSVSSLHGLILPLFQTNS